MIRRALDIGVSASVLAVTWPVIAIAAVGVKITSTGPAFYLADRVGRDGVVFQMYKIRTMRVVDGARATITAPGDERIFRLGALLRKIKIDELPQFWNVLVGEMAIVGPRPEDPAIVDEHYTPWMRSTLRWRPGITSPGAVYGYLESDAVLATGDVEQVYADVLLPRKLRLDLEYFEDATVLDDLRIIARTGLAVLGVATNRTRGST